MSIKHMILAAAASIAVLGVGTRAEAAACGVWQMSDGSRDLVFGKIDAGGGVYKVAICERGGGGSDVYSVLNNCTNSTSTSDWVEIYGGGGNDRIAPLTTATGNITCNGNTIAPYDFGLGAAIAGGQGGDLIIGTANGDLLVSDTFGTIGGDSSFDALCGRDGSDWLYGDGDDSAASVMEECLSGGNGNDYCASELGGGDMTTGDKTDGTCYGTGEYQVGAWNSTSTDCGCNSSSVYAFW